MRWRDRLEYWWEVVSWSVGAWWHRLRNRGLGWHLPNWRIVRWWDHLCWLIAGWLFHTREQIRSEGLVSWSGAEWWEERKLARAAKKVKAAERAELVGESRAARWYFLLSWTANAWFWGAHARVRVWGRSRTWSRLAGAIPVVLAVFLVLGVAFALRQQRPTALVEAYRHRAARAFEAQDYPTARMCCERLAALGQDRPSLRYRLQQTLESLGEGERAAALLEELASAAGADYAPAQVHRAEQLLATARPGGAAWQDAEQLLLRAGRWPEEADRPPEPDAAPRGALARFSDDPDVAAWLKAHQRLGQIYLQAGRPADAEPHLRAVVGAVEGAEQSEHAIHIGSEPVPLRAARRLLGRLYFQTGRLRRAEHYLRPVAEVRMPGEETAWVESQVLLGRSLLGLDQLSAAEAYLLRTVELAPAGPGRGEALAVLGQLYLRTERYDEAEKYLGEALRAPQLPPVVRAEAQAARGQFFLHKAQYAQAEQVFGLALEGLPPGHPAVATTHAQLARLCLARERRPEAEEHLRRALALPPAAPLVLTPEKKPADEAARAQLRRLQALYRERARANPWDARSALRGAAAAARLGEYAEAVQALSPARAALPLLPYLALGRHDLGAAAVWLEQRQAAPVALYRRALSELYARELEDVEAQPQVDVRQRWAVLARLLRNEPDSLAVSSRLLTVLWCREPSVEAPPEVLRTYRGEHQAAPIVRLLAAMHSLRQNEPLQTQEHLAEAMRVAPVAAVAANRLAELLVLAAPEDAATALAVSSAVLRYCPEEPHFRATRAQILAALGRWAAAVEDLQAALPQQPDQAAGHRALAEAYEHVGRSDLADATRRAAGLVVISYWAKRVAICPRAIVAQPYPP
jgi:tetratricopeptide (TPR) repeat protein